MTKDSNLLPNSLILYLASDHAGYNLRVELVAELTELTKLDGLNKINNNYNQPEVAKTWLKAEDKIIDLGTDNTTSCDYPDYANLLAQQIKQEKKICASALNR